MPAGITCVGDHGYFQLDGTSPLLTLRSKGTVITGGFVPINNASTQECSIASIPYNVGDIVAFQAAVPAAISGRNPDGSLQAMVYGVEGAAVNWWSYCRHIPSGAGFGMEVYDASGAMIYDTGRPIMRVVEEIGGVGDYALGGGRNYATICTALTARKDYYLEDSNGFAWLHIDATGGFINWTGSGFHIQNALYAGGRTDIIARSEDIPDATVYTKSYGSLDNRYTVIDVTNN